MVISRYSLPHPSLKLKIAVLADIHDRPVPQAVEAAKRERPDLILIPGDIITDHITKEAWEKDTRVYHNKRGEVCEILPWKEPVNAVRLLEELCAVAPTYFSLGNHEYSWQETDIKFVELLGVHVLNDRYERYSENVVIGGISSANKYKLKQISVSEPDISWMKEFEAEEGYRILLLHEPHMWKEYVQNTGIDLTVAGHAHGGQWRFRDRGLFSPGQGFFPEYSKGAYENGRLIVSAGLSNTAPVPRLFNPTELVLINVGS